MQLAGDIGKAPSTPNTPNRETKPSFTTKLVRRLSLSSKSPAPQGKAYSTPPSPAPTAPTTPNSGAPLKPTASRSRYKPKNQSTPTKIQRSASLSPPSPVQAPQAEELPKEKPVAPVESIKPFTAAAPTPLPQTHSRSFAFIRPVAAPVETAPRADMETRTNRRPVEEVDTNPPVDQGPVEDVPVEDGDVHTPVEGAEPDVGDHNVGETLEAQAATNFVFAHFMVGNTYPYTIDNWYDDIRLAAANGIDGFVMNVGREEWQRQRSADAFAAAKRLPESVNFKFFFSFDMSSIPGNGTGDVQLFREYLNAHGKSPRMFRHPRGGVVVSTFSGENSTFGQGSMENGWTYLKNELNKITPIYFIPSFFVNPSRYNNIPSMDGAFNWNGGWPLQLHGGMSRHEIQNYSLDADFGHLENLKDNRTFMGAVSPWFFTHYGADTWNKNWIYRGDDWLFVKRWEQLISLRNRIDIAQVISWNDYGESHYIGPIKGAQPNSQAWVDGYDHQGWMHLNAYFASAFKTGTYPTITKDQIYMWARPHPKEVNSSDRVPRPNNWQLADDTAWVIVLSKAAGTLDCYTSSSEDSKQTFSVKPGLNKISFGLQADGGMRAVLRRDGKVAAECSPVGFRFERRPGVYNFNAFVAMSN